MIKWLKRFALAVLALMGVFGYILGICKLIDLIYSNLYDNQPIYILINDGFTWVIIVLLEVVLALIVEAELSRREKVIMSAITFGVCFIASVIVASSVKVIHMEGIDTYSVGKKTVYTWEDIDTLRLEGRMDGTLRYRLITKEGRKIKVTTDISGGNKAFEEMFPDDVYDYGPWLASVLKEKGVKLELQKNLYKKLDYDSWKDLAKEIEAELNK